MIIKKLFLLFVCVLFLAAPALATDYYPCTALTGGGTGALDAIDGSGLESGDVAFVTTSAALYSYRVDATSGAAESSPDVISPDDNAGTKRWLLVGVYGATFQGADGVQITGFSNDTDLSDDSATEGITEHAAYTYITNQIAGVAAISNFAGYAERTSFAFKDTDEIYINPGRYHHDGTSEQMVYWDSQLTFQFGAGGSNASSSALAASDWFYLYIDDSAVVTLGAALLTDAEFVAVTTAPTWSNAKHGFYNGNDRCVGAFLTNASSQIIEFFHDGGELFHYADMVIIGSMSNTSWTDLDLSSNVPAFSTKAQATFYVYGDTVGGEGDGYWRTNGQTGTTGHWVGVGRAVSTYLYKSINTTQVITDSSQVIEWKVSDNDATIQCRLSGYYFPRGM